MCPAPESVDRKNAIPSVTQWSVRTYLRRATGVAVGETGYGRPGIASSRFATPGRQVEGESFVASRTTGDDSGVGTPGLILPPAGLGGRLTYPVPTPAWARKKNQPTNSTGDSSSHSRPGLPVAPDRVTTSTG